jgi:hypothetical protein
VVTKSEGIKAGHCYFLGGSNDDRCSQIFYFVIGMTRARILINMKYELSFPCDIWFNESDVPMLKKYGFEPELYRDTTVGWVVPPDDDMYDKYIVEFQEPVVEIETLEQLELLRAELVPLFGKHAYVALYKDSIRIQDDGY